MLSHFSTKDVHVTRKIAENLITQEEIFNIRLKKVKIANFTTVFLNRICKINFENKQ